jgi:hypothetical protein
MYNRAVVTPAAPSYIDLCRTNPEAGFKKAIGRTPSPPSCSRANRVFVPLIFYARGDVSEEVNNLIRQFADRISARRNQPISTALLNIEISLSNCSTTNHCYCSHRQILRSNSPYEKTLKKLVRAFKMKVENQAS